MAIINANCSIKFQRFYHLSFKIIKDWISHEEHAHTTFLSLKSYREFRETSAPAAVNLLNNY